MTIKRLPAEWEPQHALLLTWPHESGAWGKDTQKIELVFANITRAVSRTQSVIIGAYDVAHQEHISKLLSDLGVLSKVKIYLVPSNDVWARDHGPITVMQDTQAVLCDFQFTGWGDKYHYQLDDQIPRCLVDSGLLPEYEYRRIPFILEGGAIDSDGQGTLLTTEQCLRSTTRHGSLSRSEVEAHLAEYLGVNHVLWISEGHLSGDDTDGHVDTLARFFNTNTIGYVSTDDENDPHYASLKAMENTLKGFRDHANQAYQLVKLPLPAPIFDLEGNRLPATYANFLLCNQQVLVPLYQDPLDELILDIFKQHFPERTVVGVDCRAAIEQYGSLHCLTMQIPALTKR